MAEKTYLLHGELHQTVIMAVRADNIVEAVAKAESGQYVYIDVPDDSLQGFDWNKIADTVEVIEED